MPFQKGHKPYAGAFRPGQSGNPGGLPKGIERDIEKEFKAAAKEAGLRRIARLEAIADRTEIEFPDVAIRASALLLSFGFSKAPTLTDNTSTSDVNVRSRSYHMNFALSDLAPRGTYIEQAETEQDD